MESRGVLVISFTALLGLCLVATGVEAIGCYTCSGNLTTETGKACADLNSIAVIENYQSCYIRTTRDTPPAVSRGGDVLPQVSKCTGNNCFCNTQACNDRKVKIPYLTCYQCTSAEMISTGCGEGSDWFAGSTYVTQVAGCHACTKKTTRGGLVIRGCSLSAFSTNRCDSDATGSLCYCTGSLCNSAPELITSRRHLLVSSLVLMLSTWLLY